jgi:hypothetical protein
MLYGISCELAGCVHRTEIQPNLSQLNLSQLSLAKPAKLNFFKTPASGMCKLQILQASSHILFTHSSEPVFVNLLRSPGIDSQLLCGIDSSDRLLSPLSGVAVQARQSTKAAWKRVHLI